LNRPFVERALARMEGNVRGKLLPGGLFFVVAGLLPAVAFAQAETEPNDSKAQANLFTMPAVNTAGVIVGNSIAATGTELDYFRVTTPAQAAPGFYRHRLITQSTTPGHTVTIRGLNQAGGVIGTTDTAVQTSSAATTPARFVQWYTSQATADLYVRVAGTAATTANYSLDYEVQAVTELTGPTAVPGSITITSVGQSVPQTDTDLWVYDSNRAAITDFGNDDEFAGTTLGSILTRTYAAGTFHLAISNFNVANNLATPPDDDFRSGAVMDFPGVVANSSATVGLSLNTLIGGVAAPATKAGPFDVVFVAFGVTPPVAPISLAVDAGGNGVLQPNETAVVAPTWRNTSAAPISLTGAASNFTGPVGPTYTLTDATADYGTIAVSSNASCSTGGDCYSVNISGNRPAQHWDATVLETVNPGATTKTWTLHVGDSFTDVPSSNPFYRFIETLLHKGVTGGCGGTNYCPSTATTREQMAVFVLLSKEGVGYNPPACAPPNTFTDVPDTSPFCRFIEELAARGVVSGCGPNLYCPTSPVTRDAMSVFALRTLDPSLNPPACVGGSEMFADVPAGNGFCRWIEELARRGIVSGCGNGNYCPTSPVTREQMGVFLSATFGLTLYGL
jgi:hypothetical protein